MTESPTPAPEPTDADTGTEGTAAEQPATEPPHDPPPGMRWDEQTRGFVDVQQPAPRTREERYRLALRATEGERDQLRERLDLRDRADVERDVAGKLIDPQDLWAADVKLSDLRGENGEIDTAAVDTAVAAVIEAHPHWATPRVSPAAPAAMVTSAEKPDVDADQQPTWQSVIQSAMRKP